MLIKDKEQARAVGKADNTTHVSGKSLSSDSVVCFVNTYPLDSDLSAG